MLPPVADPALRRDGQPMIHRDRHRRCRPGSQSFGEYCRDAEGSDEDVGKALVVRAVGVGPGKAQVAQLPRLHQAGLLGALNFPYTDALKVCLLARQCRSG